MPLAARPARLLLACALLLAWPARAAADAVRVRWAPSEDPGVAGYRVYVRPLEAGWNAPEDAGLPAPAADGSLGWVVDNLDLAADWAFAVAAYRGDGMESALSNEMLLAASRPPECAADADCGDADACTTGERCVAGRCARDPVVCAPPGGCAEAICDPLEGCLVRPLPDGSPCDAGDPCAGGVCSAGTCSLPPAAFAEGAVHPLRVGRFVVRPRGRRAAVVAAGSFAPGRPVDPAASGVAVRVREGVVDVVLRAALEAPPPPGTGRLGWVLRLGGACARDASLVCGPRRGRGLRCE
jgi:hypothetical protein